LIEKEYRQDPKAKRTYTADYKEVSGRDDGSDEAVAVLPGGLPTIHCKVGSIAVALGVVSM
jgi:hypothetical protein